MKNFIVIYFILVSALSSQPLVKLGLLGGYDIALPDLAGDVTKYDDNFNSYVMKSGFGFGASAKYYPDKSNNTGFTLSLAYHMFSNSADSVFIPSEVAYFTAKDLKRNLNIFSVGVGLEYSLMPGNRVNPFGSAEFTWNFFSGGYDYIYAGFHYATDQRTESRYGITGGIGVDIALSKSIGMTLGAKYHIANLIGKDSTGASAKAYGLDDREYITVLGDKIYARTISFIQTYIGVSYYFNTPKKDKKDNSANKKTSKYLNYYFKR